jgi:hypothetical protein
MHEVPTRRCASKTSSLHWIGIKICGPHKYDGLNYISFFVKEFELQVLEKQSILALYVFLKVTPAKWWVAHREGMKY